MTSIAVFGAGSIGCYVGGRLAAGGSAVTLIGRARLGNILQTQGLMLSDYLGWQHTLAATDIHFSSDAAAIADADLVLVSVKSGDTAAAAQTLASATKPG